MACLNAQPVLKAPVAEIYLEYDLQSYLGPTETIEESPAPEFSSSPPGLVFSAQTLSQDFKSVQVLAEQGKAYQDYFAVLKYTSSLGQVDQVSMWVRVLPT